MDLPDFPIFTFSELALADFLARPCRSSGATTHLEEAVAWLERAQDATQDGGVSYGYSLKGGWRSSYVETTGYIAETFYDLARDLQREEYRRRANRMVDWLLEVQLGNGAFTNKILGVADGIVFDTGQDLLGIERAYQETNDGRYADAADRACQWLVETAADNQGKWTRHTHNSIPHVYNTRVAWALLRSWQRTGEDRWLRVARANLDWAVSEQQNGWFHNCAFVPDVAPFTHTLAYAIRGLWESSEILGDDGYRRSAISGANAVIRSIRPGGAIPGRINTDGQVVDSSCCLSGNCQLAIIWAKLYQSINEVRYRDAAVAALRFVLARQNCEHRNPGIRGAIKGSHPIWGGYSPMTYPNWATKFFVDALLLCKDWL